VIKIPIPEYLELGKMISKTQTPIPEFLERAQNLCATHSTLSEIAESFTEFLHDTKHQFQIFWKMLKIIV
jgi:hypothetical protein